MDQNHKAPRPATALPWTAVEKSPTYISPIVPLEWHYTRDDDGIHFNPQDAAYIAHAANAYPKLVEALREIVDPTGGWTNLRVDNAKAAADLLRSLGEE